MSRAGTKNSGSEPLINNNKRENRLALTKCFSPRTVQTKKINHLSSSHCTPNSPRCITKTSSINACYTPSSLFRNANIKSTCNRGLAHKEPQLAHKEPQLAPNFKSDPPFQGDDRLTVAVRVRPLDAEERSLTTVTNVTLVKNTELTVIVDSVSDSSCRVRHSFVYDKVFYSCDPEAENYATQEDVYLGTAQPLIQRAFDGFNACLFAYGQTGSGKSYSMMGLGTSINKDCGIIPRFCDDLFKQVKQHKGKYQTEIEVSYFEIYNEKIHDLLCVHQDDVSDGLKQPANTPGSNRKALKVREHPTWGPYVVGLSIHPVDTFEALQNWLIVGNSQRACAATGLNDKSSRSHSIFNIMVNITDTDSRYCTDSTDGASYKSPEIRQSKISLVDLAGSERIQNSNGERKREGVHINKSLLTLGKVISALANEKNLSHSKMFVPYRESVLTWLLRENLGGNSKTVMLATISPASTHIDETLATLRYACQASRIVNRIKVNESQHDKTIRELRSEVERLKSLHYEYERRKRLSGNTNSVKVIVNKFNVNETEMQNLKEQLLEREEELQNAQKSWMERLKESEDLRKSELLLLKRKGLALELFKDRNQACLVNLSEDPMISGTLFYILPPGCVTIGRTRSTFTGIQPDIILDGPLIAHTHCTIDNIDGMLYLTPESKDFDTYLNGELVSSRTQIFHGDRLVFGVSQFYRVYNPNFTGKENQKLFDSRSSYQEIVFNRGENVQFELENEKRNVFSRIGTDEEHMTERLEQIKFKQLVLRCDEEILESERKSTTEKSKQLAIIQKSMLKSCHANNSNLLEQINNIIQNPSEGCTHKIKLLVNEANQHCANNKIMLEFQQSYEMDEYGVCHFKIIIIDKEKKLKAEWPTARLEVWLNAVREQEFLNAGDIFEFVDIDWQLLDSSYTQQPNANDVNDTILRKSSDSLPDSNRLTNQLHFDNKLVTNNGAYDFENLAMTYLQHIQDSTENLRNLCAVHSMENNSNYCDSLKVIRESIERVKSSLTVITSCLDNRDSHKENIEKI